MRLTSKMLLVSIVVKSASRASISLLAAAALRAGTRSPRLVPTSEYRSHGGPTPLTYTKYQHMTTTCSRQVLYSRRHSYVLLDNSHRKLISASRVKLCCSLDQPLRLCHQHSKAASASLLHLISKAVHAVLTTLRKAGQSRSTVNLVAKTN